MIAPIASGKRGSFAAKLISKTASKERRKIMGKEAKAPIQSTRKDDEEKEEN